MGRAVHLGSPSFLSLSSTDRSFRLRQKPLSIGAALSSRVFCLRINTCHTAYAPRGLARCSSLQCGNNCRFSYVDCALRCGHVQDCWCGSKINPTMILGRLKWWEYEMKSRKKRTRVLQGPVQNECLARAPGNNANRTI